MYKAKTEGTRLKIKNIKNHDDIRIFVLHNYTIYIREHAIKRV